MTLNRLSFIRNMIYQLSRAASLYSDDDRDEAIKIVERFCTLGIHEPHEDEKEEGEEYYTREEQIFVTKKILFDLGGEYPEFHTIYALFDDTIAGIDGNY